MPGSLLHSLRHRTRTTLVGDVTGGIDSVWQHDSATGTWARVPSPHAAATGGARPCTLLLPGGAVALRRAPRPLDDKNEALAALQEEATRTMMREPRLGCSHMRAVHTPQGELGVLAWLPTEQLHNWLEAASALGYAPRTILVPELDLTGPGQSLLVLRTDDTLRLCVTHEHMPVSWQSVETDAAAFGGALDVLTSELRALGLPRPLDIVWLDQSTGQAGSGSDVPSADHAAALSRFAPGVIARTATTRREAIDLLAPRSGGLRLFGSGGSFSDCLDAWESAPLTGRQVARLGLNLACALAGCLLFFLAVTNMHQQEVQTLQKEAGSLKVLAYRYDGAMKRIHRYMDHNKELHRYTTGKPFASHLFHDLADAIPKQVRLTTLRLARDGGVTLSGTARNEISLIAFLERLGTTEVLRTPRLSSMNTLDKNEGVRFVINADYPKWRSFFGTRGGQS